MYLKEKYVNQFTDFGFKKLFEAAEIAKFSPAEMSGYEQSLKYYRDMKNVIDTSYDEGRAEGVQAGKVEIARKALLQGLPVAQISELTGLSVADIQTLQKES
ncbi:MAG: hypothetical protein JNJ90_01945 [Saprospiraceae bacterium]|jgi:predicted transposase/invertase (TIGR01784 family)|nr:hypothetical protein [Saprospiraceae bacterium]